MNEAFLEQRGPENTEVEVSTLLAETADQLRERAPRRARQRFADLFEAFASIIPFQQVDVQTQHASECRHSGAAHIDRRLARENVEPHVGRVDGS